MRTLTRIFFLALLSTCAFAEERFLAVNYRGECYVANYIKYPKRSPKAFLMWSTNLVNWSYCYDTNGAKLCMSLDKKNTAHFPLTNRMIFFKLITAP